MNWFCIFSYLNVSSIKLFVNILNLKCVSLLEQIGDIVYEFLWYDLRSNESQFLILVILRSQKD